MLLNLMRKRLLSIRNHEFITIQNLFHRQSKNSRWSLLKKDNSHSSPDATNVVLSSRSLIKPFIFTVSFSCLSFAGATIWQYEEMRKLARRLANSQSGFLEKVYPQYKRSEFRRQMNTWWNSQSQGQKIALVIAAINTGVFVLWRVPALLPFMTKYFSSTPASSSTLPMFLSTFSHYSFMHLAANMYVLYTFSGAAVGYFGKEQFVAVYLSAGVVSSFISHAYKVAIGSLSTSLGASGALMAILSAVCFQFPYIQLQILFVPFFKFTSGNAIKAIMAFDFVGMIARWQLFDHAAHIGGALFGLLYLKYGHDYIWMKRELLFRWYHKIREK